jgi:hypothetical protein
VSLAYLEYLKIVLNLLLHQYSKSFWPSLVLELGFVLSPSVFAVNFHSQNRIIEDLTSFSREAIFFACVTLLVTSTHCNTPWTIDSHSFSYMDIDHFRGFAFIQMLYMNLFIDYLDRNRWHTSEQAC